MILVYAILVVLTAWLGDDAYITFRTADNFVNGYGLRWNVDERVQTYTHPLWMLVFSTIYFFTREVYFTILVLSLLCSIAAVSLVCFTLSISWFNAFFVILFLILSKAFLDYSTSGLENPLTHLLLGLFFLQLFQIDNYPDHTKTRNLFLLSFITALLLCTRMDLALILIPCFLYVVFRRNVTIQEFSVVLGGMLPFFAWELFSIVYYGFPFPNTAYAKLNTGLNEHLLMQQGLRYLLNSISWDPITLIVICTSTVYSLIHFRRNPMIFMMGLGMMLYLLYVIRIGGDFMSGRFLTPVFFCAVILFARLPKDRTSRLVYASVLLVSFTCSILVEKQIEPPLRKKIDRFGIADERLFWYPVTGFLNVLEKGTIPDSRETRDAFSHRREDQKVRDRYIVGMYGFYMGPSFHIVDCCALADPLMARLPVRGNGMDWRIGHFERDMPHEYLSILNDRSQIEDQNLREYSDKLNRITRGEIWDVERFMEIWRFNTGQYDHLIEEYCTHNYHQHRYDEWDAEVEKNRPWGDPRNVILNRYGIGITDIPSELRNAEQFSIGLHGGETYKIVFYREQEKVSEMEITIPRLERGEMTIKRFSIPSNECVNQFDWIRIKPCNSFGKPSLGHFRLLKNTMNSHDVFFQG